MYKLYHVDCFEWLETCPPNIFHAVITDPPNLRKHQTGGLRRIGREAPFVDVIESGRTPVLEREICPHPSLKPQHFLRQLVYAALPLGVGTILDPFAGGGSTLAACEAMGVDSVGIEIDEEYYYLASKAIPKLHNLQMSGPGDDEEEKFPAQLPLFND